MRKKIYFCLFALAKIRNKKTMEENVEGLNNQKDKIAEGEKGNKQEIKTRRKILNLLEKAFAIE